MTRSFALSASAVFDGERLHDDAAVVVEGDAIRALVPRGELPAGLPVEALPDGAWLGAGFVDLQVNGGGDVLFNDEPTPEGIARIAAAHRRSGTTGLLPTLITDRREVMERALDAVAQARAANPGVLGIHLEGPFISPAKAGVHDPARIRRADADDLRLLVEGREARGITLVTLAPEEAPEGFVASLKEAGIRVWLGHSMASYEETKRALREGVCGFTHLFNAMRPLGSRDPGPIAAALETPGCHVGLIMDGIHVHPAVLRLALRGAAEPVLVTDAMPPVGGARDAFMLHGERIEVRDGRCLRGDGTLAGAHLTMAGAVRNAVRLLGLSLPRALAMASAAPARALGLGATLGRIAPGCRADLVAIEPEEVAVLRTWVAGREEA
jgi:N-acetylglucosamine-6-phosphate deacetylase